MANTPDRPNPPEAVSDSPSSTATHTQPAPSKPKHRPLPPWKVLLHNDDVNSHEHVIKTIVMLTTLNEQDAILRTVEAEAQGVSLLLTTNRERAELYQQQFTSRSLTVTIEPA